MTSFSILDNIEKIKKKIKLSFENIKKMEHLLQKSKCSIFHNIFNYMIFQRHQKVLLWSKWLTVNNILSLSMLEVTFVIC